MEISTEALNYFFDRICRVYGTKEFRVVDVMHISGEDEVVTVKWLQDLKRSKRAELVGASTNARTKRKSLDIHLQAWKLRGT